MYESVLLSTNKKGVANGYCGRVAQTLVRSLGSFSGPVVRKFFLGVVNDWAIEIHEGLRVKLHCVLLNQSGNSQQELLLPIFFPVVLSQCWLVSLLMWLGYVPGHQPCISFSLSPAFMCPMFFWVAKHLINYAS